MIAATVCPASGGLLSGRRSPCRSADGVPIDHVPEDGPPRPVAQKPAYSSPILAFPGVSERGNPVDDSNRVLLINADTVLRGEISNGGRIEICGYVEGNVVGEDLVIRPGGRCYGTIEVQTADIQGTLQGEIAVRHLMNVRSTGCVTGNVKYGRLAMELGGDLSAELHNIPPTIGGDLDLAVAKGRSVRITLQDLNALDPDDKAQDLTFTVSGARNGRVTLSNDPDRPVQTFTQADLERGSVMFLHDGTDTLDASFDVVVADKAGASSGGAQTVKVAVRGQA